ncbi:MAG: DUF4835 family protein [Candidatus Marinimicrobia bacterium]|nr:DUF4835 family protein [Candidatus Neomarinimicrobiota bacterium]
MKNTIFLLMLLPTIMVAQGVTAEIKVDTKNLDEIPRQATSDLANDIQYYIENTQWTFDDLPTEFTIQATIYLDTYTESGYQKIYTGKAFWGNGDDQKYFDKSWQFAFNQGEPLTRSRSFNSLTSFLDFWTLTILGGDLDTWNEFGGSQLYTEARQVARDGTKDPFSIGWKERLEDIEKLSRNQNYRKMKFAYYEAIDRWDSGQKEDAKKTLENFMRNLEISIKNQDTRILTQNFLKAKYQELGDFLWEVKDLSFLQRLMHVDDEHREYYEDILADW